MRRRHQRMLATATALSAAGLLLAGCATSPRSDAEAPEGPAAEGRLAVAYENGLAVLDPETLEIVDEFETEEFTRLNAAGDARHVLVTTSAGFQVLDTAAPELTDLVFEADTAGHVVRHGGKTVLYADGTSETTIFETDALAAADGELPETQTHRADAAHHGVSIVLEDGTLLTTVGNADGRTGAMALEPHEDHWHELTVSDQCPGIHGEGTAQDEAVVFGCENGALLFKDGEFIKLQAPAEYGRMGNAYVSETSPLVVGDYKDDPDAEGYLLHAVTLIDTAAETYEVVELPIEFTYRDVARGPEDLAYIIATDGSIHVLDPARGDLVDEFPVIEAWEGPAEWQDPHPAIVVNGDIAFVSEPAANTLHAVDLTTGEIVASVELDEAPNEMAVALG
ncbi:zinc metallochaperone AztD [Microbacterium sp. NPDC003461]